ncbi:aryl-alcohol dehydrogenase-like predicted oxidoreductase [Sphingobium wenxiniae]|uniref:Aryl-alcohol dehydrogenase-like predicted oxidoreductase n=1 Tax=Sphingobium wenxiniae (strain DSM 21828 / CGMCC 1.7748 / JZ-1) TaxID=595605 RepID=A0A562KMN7_SPHWJ|nr:aldo/keto reductase [Sphingobium wenxiniae]MBB6191896.1 aryl-alcohol dehydrogenase-like predicted oxidoreductase [Sphingobium wenxiniae]TWH96679.1 aryl-alcohol dehydrogenase-like predicted oxidoreductase [Sphingobium wenxiniae]
MRYARLGNSGLVVSRMAFGTMTMGSGMSPALARLGSSESDRLIGQALDAGVNFFDTANVYHAGESERILGAALGARRNDAVIATKVGMRMSNRLDDSGLSARNINQSLNASLERLGTDHVDVLLCHRNDPTTPLEETLAALDRVVQEGKVRYLGFSNWPAWEAAKAVALQKANDWAPFVTGQMYYSLVGRDIEHDYVPFALDAGVGTMVWSPLAGGFLSGKYTRDNPTGGGGRIATLDIVPFDRERGFDIVDVLREIAGGRGTSVAAIALSWLADRPSVSTVIIGFADETQMRQNLEASDLILTEDERARLDAAASVELPYPQSFLSRFAKDPAVVAVR